MNHFCEHMAFVSQVEPKSVIEALEDSNWINAMHEELTNLLEMRYGHLFLDKRG